jgi:hypothetical protein
MINFEGVVNPLSFGFVTVSLAKCFRDKNIDFNFFPIGGNIDWSVFDKIDENLKNYINSSASNALAKFDINDKSFKVWHINDSWRKLSKKENYLLTFSEVDTITNEEICILNSFDKIFVTSTFSKGVFTDYGVKCPIVYVPMGVNEEIFYDIKQPRPFKDIICWSIFGKAESRKAHLQTIQAWLSKFSNNPRHKLHLFISNPFLKPEQFNVFLSQVFSGNPKPYNVDIFPYLPTNSQLNQSYNATDIVIDMSGGESISLGSLSCLSMGKIGIIHYNSGMRDWANENNAILIKPSGKRSCFDGVFFGPGKFNQGNLYQYKTEDLLNAFDIAIKRFESNPDNTEGRKLIETYSFKVGADIILKEMEI